jgi:hypothetical protein
MTPCFLKLVGLTTIAFFGLVAIVPVQKMRNRKPGLIKGAVGV